MPNSSKRRPVLKRDVLEYLGIFWKQERKLIVTLLMYAIAVGLFSLIVPLTVQELVNTFAFSIQPGMLVILLSIMAGILAFVAIFRALQFYVNDLVLRRIFARMTLTFARVFPTIQSAHFRNEYTSRFFEIVFMQRAFSATFVEVINVLVSGVIGMILLVLYHPLFLVIDFFLILAVLIIGFLGKGGLQDTLHMSEAKYDTYHWFLEVAENLDHFKASQSRDLILEKADGLAHAYVQARMTRFRDLMRQYIGSLSLQVLLHTGTLGMAGWLVARDELTIGQLVAAEVVIGAILTQMDSVTKRIYVFFYFAVALIEMYYVLWLPKDHHVSGQYVRFANLPPEGISLSVSQLKGLPSPWPPDFELNIDLKPGDKSAFICRTESQRQKFSRILAGLDMPPHGSIQYNGVNIHDLHPDDINSLRSVVLSRHLSLFEGTLLENITLKRHNLSAEDLQWVSDFLDLQEFVEQLPEGLQTRVEYGREDFVPSQILKILLARALIVRPKLLLIDGGLHELPPIQREKILKKICQPEQPWTVVIVTTDQKIEDYVQQQVSLT
jgi:putative ABC transport system ATP-binding protein